MTPEETFIREWFKMPEDCKFEVEVVFIRPEQWMEAMKEYARRHAGNGWTACLEYITPLGEPSDLTPNPTNKPAYLLQTFGE